MTLSQLKSWLLTLLMPLYSHIADMAWGQEMRNARRGYTELEE